MNIRVGFGYDVHKLVENRDLWLGGIKIDYEQGLLGHSDADVLIHAICDALLGAANMRDIGYHFPDTAAETLNVDSKILLRKTMELIATKGYTLGNIDATVCAERPKLNPHVPAMKACLAEVMGVDEDQISIKATTTEKLGFTGRMEGISAYATVLIQKDRTQAARRPERAKALYSAKCRKSVRKLLISVSFVHFCLIYIKKCKNVTLSWLNIW